MSSEEEFDKIIRQKAEEGNHPFSEENWEKARRMIDGSRHTASPGLVKGFILPGLLFLACGAAGVIAVSYMNNESAIIATTGEPLTKVAEEPVAPLSVPDRSTGAENGVSAFSSLPETASLNTIDKPARLETKEVSSRPAAAVSIRESDRKITSGQEQASKPANTVTDETDDNSVTFSNKPDAFAGRRAGGASSISKLFAPGTFIYKPVIQQPASASDATEEKNETPVSSSDISSAVVNNETAEVTASEEVVSVSFEYLDPLSAMLPGAYSDPEPALSITALPHHEPDYYHPRKLYTNYLDIEAGSSWLNGWTTAQGRDGQGFNWYGGFNYGHYLSRRIIVATGLQVYSISHISQPYYSTEKIEYHFSSTTTNTFVTSDKLVYAAVPLSLNFELCSKLQAGVGVNAAYLLSSENRYDSRVAGDASAQTTNVLTQRSVMEGQNRFNLMLSASIRMKLCTRMAIHAEGLYGVSDLFSNNTFSGNTEKPMGFRLGVQFILFER